LFALILQRASLDNLFLSPDVFTDLDAASLLAETRQLSSRRHNGDMTESGRFDHLRSAALDMLDAGNSMASVSQMLAIPATEIARWRAEPAPQKPQPQPQPATVAQQGGGRGSAPRFRTTLVVRRHFPQAWANHEATAYVVTAVWVALIAFTLHNPAAFGELLFVLDATATFACVLWWNQRLRPVITLTSDAIVVPTLFGRTTMPYAELADWSLVTHEKLMKYKGREIPIAGWLLTLSSRRPGGRPIELFMHAHVALGQEVTERLDLVKQANTGLHPVMPKVR
jgi:hypothetical protein